MLTTTEAQVVNHGSNTIRFSAFCRCSYFRGCQHPPAINLTYGSYTLATEEVEGGKPRNCRAQQASEHCLVLSDLCDFCDFLELATSVVVSASPGLKPLPTNADNHGSHVCAVPAGWTVATSVVVSVCRVFNSPIATRLQPRK